MRSNLFDCRMFPTKVTSNRLSELSIAKGLARGHCHLFPVPVEPRAWLSVSWTLQPEDSKMKTRFLISTAVGLVLATAVFAQSPSSTTTPTTSQTQTPASSSTTTQKAPETTTTQTPSAASTTTNPNTSTNSPQAQ